MDNSQAYGRNPFIRRCNDCVGSYKSKNHKINTEKLASSDGSSITDKMWRNMSVEQRKGWFIKMKRDRKLEDRGRHHDISKHFGTVSVGSTASTGRRTVGRMTMFVDFYLKNKLLGKKLPDIQEEWKVKLRNPLVHKERHVIDGKSQILVEDLLVERTLLASFHKSC